LSNIGRGKAACVFEQVRDINPQAKIEYSDAGVRNEDDVDCLVSGADVVIDEMDYHAWKESLWLGRAARKAGIYYLFVSAIGFGAMSVAFSPDGMTLEEFNGLPPDIDLAAEKEISVPKERILPVVPSYVTTAMSMEMMQDILGRKRPVPTCSIGVGLASILAAEEAMNIILRRKEIVVAPRFTHIDFLDRKFVTGEIG
jgi:molybdopterin/thiamine biosynthesis adenylyltransferase